MWISVFSYLELIELPGCVNSCFSSNLGSLQPLFLQMIFFTPSYLPSPSGTVIYVCWFSWWHSTNLWISVIFLHSLFLFCFSDWIISVTYFHLHSASSVWYWASLPQLGSQFLAVTLSLLVPLPLRSLLYLTMAGVWAFSAFWSISSQSLSAVKLLVFTRISSLMEKALEDKNSLRKNIQYKLPLFLLRFSDFSWINSSHFCMTLVDFQDPEIDVIDNFVKFYCCFLQRGFATLLSSFWKSCSYSSISRLLIPRLWLWNLCCVHTVCGSLLHQ